MTIYSKICTTCKISKPITEFSKDKTSKDGLQPRCKSCHKKWREDNKEARAEKAKQYREDNKEARAEYNKQYREDNKEARAEYNKQYREDNKQSIAEKDKQYRENNKEARTEYDKHYNKQYREDNKQSIAERDKQYREDNKEARAEYNKQHGKQYREDNKESIAERNKRYQSERKKRDPLFKLTGNIRGLIRSCVKKGGFTKTTKTAQILGCSFAEFKTHIESQFTEGMTWDNHGDWHFDHKTPVSWALTEEEIIALNHFSNFQPLWAIDNIRKGNRFAD